MTQKPVTRQHSPLPYGAHSAAPPHPHCKDPRRRFSKIVCLLLSLNVMRKADVFTLIFALEGAGEAHVTDCALSSAADSGASL